MPKFDLKSMNITTLFNLVKTKPSEEVESFIHKHKIDINIINEKLNMSVLSAINMGMSDMKTFTKSKENALFVVQQMDNPFYRNKNDNIDIIETFILNQKSIKNDKHDHLDEAIMIRIYERYKGKDIPVFQKDLCHTLKNMINDDTRGTSIIEDNIASFFQRANKFEDVMNSLINTQLLKLMDEDDTFFPSIEDTYSELFNFKYAYAELSDTIVCFLKKYKNPEIADFVFTFFDNKGKLKGEFLPDLFKILIYIGAEKPDTRRQEKLINIFSKLDYKKYPLLKDQLDTETNEQYRVITTASPNVYAAILEYCINSKFNSISEQPAKKHQRSRL